jgi:formylglycine-generating enzyme required for sulfatase activity
VRLRLYRSGKTTSGTPRARSTIEAVVSVPEVPEMGRRDAHVLLPTDAVGSSTGTLAAPVPAEVGRAPGHRVGSWAGAAVVPCAAEPMPGETCVPGGAQWRGDPRLDLSAYPDLGGAEEQLVVLSPFYLDVTEVSVAAFRSSGLAVSLTPGGPSDNPHEKDTGIAHCTYTSQSSDTDSLAVNCVSWSLAQAYCESLGKRLPTEAELERAASALGRHPFVWGQDEPRCEDAVFDRGAPGKPCSELGLGVAPPGSGARDRLLLGDREVVDLVGNVAEWTADRYNDKWPACFAPALSYDPRCDALSSDGNEARIYRGGDYDTNGPLLRASVYSWVAFEDTAVSARIGIRCARDGG